MTVKAPSPEKLGRRIRKLRQDKSLSQEDLAQPDYTAAYISHIEHGKRRASREVLGHIASRLGMTLEQLVSGRDPDEDLRLEIAAQQAMADIHQGRAKEALATLEEVRHRAAQTDNKRVLEDAEAAIGLALFRLGRTSEAQGAYERALELLEGAPPERRTTAVAGKSRCLLESNEAREAVHLLEAHLLELQRADEPDPSCLVETYAALIPGYFELDMTDMASHVATKGWKLAPDIPDPERRACLYVNRAQLMVTQGDIRQALASLALAEDLYRHLGWYAEAVKVSFARSYALMKQGDLVEAETVIRKALSTPGTVVRKSDRIRILNRLASIRRRQQDPEEALTLAREALKLAGARSVGSAADAQREIGLCLLQLGDQKGGVSHLRKALKGFSQTGEDKETARTARLLGDHLSEAGDTDGAATAYRLGLPSG